MPETEERRDEDARKGNEHWPQEEDRVPHWWTLALMIGTVVIVFISIAWSWWLARRATGGLPEAAAIPMQTLRNRATSVPLTVGGVRQTMIADERAGQKLNRRKRIELEQYEWADRQRGLVRIPIERAMDLVIAEQRHAGERER